MMRWLPLETGSRLLLSVSPFPTPCMISCATAKPAGKCICGITPAASPDTPGTLRLTKLAPCALKKKHSYMEGRPTHSQVDHRRVACMCSLCNSECVWRACESSCDACKLPDGAHILGARGSLHAGSDFGSHLWGAD